MWRWPEGNASTWGRPGLMSCHPRCHPEEGQAPVVPAASRSKQGHRENKHDRLNFIKTPRRPLQKRFLIKWSPANSSASYLHGAFHEGTRGALQTPARHPVCVNYRSGGGTLGFAPPAAGEAGPVSASLMVQCYTCLKEKRV